MFLEFKNKLWRLSGNLRSEAVWCGKAPKLDKIWIARLYVLMWRVMEADKECRASDLAWGEGRETVSDVVRRMEVYFNPVMERVRREVEMSMS